MLKIYDYECPIHGSFEALVEGNLQVVKCVRCLQDSPKIISSAQIHTLETHMRGYRDSDGHYSPADGTFTDPNLCGRDGKPSTYSSPREKQKIMDQLGLYQKPTKKKKQYFS